MLTKSEVIASLNEGVKARLVATAQNVMVGMVNDRQVETAVVHYINGLRVCREFHDRALKAIEVEFKE